MHNMPQTKRIIIAATYKETRVFQGVGLKVHDLLQTLQNEKSHDHTLRRHDSSFEKGLDRHGSFEHHMDPKTIEKEAFAHDIVEKVRDIIEHHQETVEIILMAEPKMLGYLRHHMEKVLPHTPIYKSLSVDPAHMDMLAIEGKVFS